jgi:NAD(P)-dependent dehydrogenase (short-subunit alcohol dehydrogenase family)
VSRKVAIVTGGAQGIGEATVQAFRSRDWRVVIADLCRTEELIDPFVTAYAADVSDQGSVIDVVKKTVDEFGRIDALVNNAGIQRWSSVPDMDLAVWERVISINFFGGLIFTNAVCKQMIDQGRGSIVNVLSIMAERGAPNRGPYSASKAALQAMTRTAAVELGPKGIRVNAVGPGYIETPLMKEYFESEKVDRRAIEDSVPLRRIGSPEEVAEVIVFLASDRASYISGQSVFVDGGFLADSGIR